MANEMVTIGCRLPNGYVLETGLQTTVRGGPQNGLIPLIERKDDYQRIKLKGTHWHNAAIFRLGQRPPSILAPEPFINQIPKDFWERWKKEHSKGSTLPAVLKNGDLIEIPNKDGGASIKAAVLDSMSRPASLAPTDPSKPFKVGNDTVETADFSETK